MFPECVSIVEELKAPRASDSTSRWFQIMLGLIAHSSGGVCIKSWPIWQGMRRLLARARISGMELSGISSIQ
jgi:hypothetical protein